MSFTGHVANGVVVFDGPAPPDGTPVRVEPTANGKPPAETPVRAEPAAHGPPPADNSDIDPDGVMTPQMIAFIRAANAECPDGPALAEGLPNWMKHTFDMPPDASRQVDHYVYGKPKR